jgi:DNA-directed RNA polymerase alpha subunit
MNTLSKKFLRSAAVFLRECEILRSESKKAEEVSRKNGEDSTDMGQLISTINAVTDAVSQNLETFCEYNGLLSIDEPNLSMLKLSVRIRNCILKIKASVCDEKGRCFELKDIKINEILRLTDKELLSIRNFGVTSLKELDDELARQGFVRYSKI